MVDFLGGCGDASVEPMVRPIPATNRETLARLLPQAAKPKPLRAKYA